MAAPLRACDQPSLEMSIHMNVDPEKNQNHHHHYQQEAADNELDYSQRAQWLRAAVLGANDGLVSVASLMMGIGAIKKDIKPMLISGFTGLVAGACSMAIGEFVSVYTQRDIEIAQKKRNVQKSLLARGEDDDDDDDEEENEEEKLPNPAQAALASALAFVAGAVVPLLGSAFVRDYNVRLAVVVGLASIMLVIFGIMGAVLGRTPVARSCVRVVIGGWVAMAITFGLTKSIGFGRVEI